MTLPTHLLLGLLVGKVTGQYIPAIVGSVVIDLDHITHYLKNGVLREPRKLWDAMLIESDHSGEQRGLLHNIFAWAVVSGAALYFLPAAGAVFSVAYFAHLLLDALDRSDFYPFLPFKAVSLKGPIHYSSKSEYLFAGMLLMLLFVV